MGTLRVKLIRPLSEKCGFAVFQKAFVIVSVFQM